MPYFCLDRCRVEPLSRLLVELQISLIAAVGGRLQSVGDKGIGWSNFLATYYYCLPRMQDPNKYSLLRQGTLTSSGFLFYVASSFLAMVPLSFHCTITLNLTSLPLRSLRLMTALWSRFKFQPSLARVVLGESFS